MSYSTIRSEAEDSSPEAAAWSPLSYQRRSSSVLSAATSRDSHEIHPRDRCRWSFFPSLWMKSLLLVTLVLLFVMVVRYQEFSPLRRPPSDHVMSTNSHEEKCQLNEEETNSVQSLKESSVLTGLSRGAVAADHPVCSDIGLSVLQELHGNAVDAAVATALCLGVANPASSGLGGGAFMLLHADDLAADSVRKQPDFIDARADKQHSAVSGKMTEVVDCREMAPKSATTNMYLGQPKHASERGGLAVGVPGELTCLELAHARHGVLEWNQVVQPAYELAAKGAVINPNLEHEIGILAHRYSVPFNKNLDWGLRAMLTHNDTWSTPLKAGEILKNPKLAETLKAIRDGGSDALYKGERAANLARDIQMAGGIVTQEDIESYKPTLRTPVVAHDISGFSIVGAPPPSSGGATIIGAARFLAEYQTPYATFADTLSMHHLVEATKHAFAIRMSLSDPDYDSETVNEAVFDLVEGPYMKDLVRATRDNATLPLSQYGGAKWAQLHDSDGQSVADDANEGDRRLRRKLARRFGNLEDGGTSHFSIVDKDGNAVAMTTSINTYFGSNVLSPSTGIVLSNTMDDFATPGRPNYFGLHPSKSNFIKPGKKPLSSMSPTMVFRRPNDDSPLLGDLALVLGCSGGPKIISAVLQVLANVILRGMPLFDALVHSRVHDQLVYHGAAVTTLENTVLKQGPAINVSNKTRQALQERGHGLLDVNYEGTVQVVMVDLDSKQLAAGCDVRKGGSPAGY